jgi:hypothetical protein
VGLLVLSFLSAFLGFSLFFAIALSSVSGSGADRFSEANVGGILFGMLFIAAGYFVAIGLYFGALTLALRTSMNQSVGFGEAAGDGLRIVWHSALAIPAFVILAILVNVIGRANGGLAFLVYVFGGLVVLAFSVAAIGVGLRKALDGHVRF